MDSILEDLKWRYATKKFDSNKKVSKDDLNTIKESLRLVPTSYGLQSLKYIIVESKDIREKLVKASFNQQQIKDASHLIVICTYKVISDDIIDDFIELTAKTRNQDIENIIGFGDYMKSTLNEMGQDKVSAWSSRQAYIALGQLLHTCANLRIDATPMEGFVPSEYNQILGLNDTNLTATLVCPIGYRHVEDKNQYLAKVRKPINELFEVK